MKENSDRDANTQRDEAKKRADDAFTEAKIPHTSGDAERTHNAWNIGGQQSSHVNKGGDDISGRTSNSVPGKSPKDITGL